MSEQNSELAPRLAAAMRDVRRVQDGRGQATERIQRGRLAGGRRVQDGRAAQEALEDDTEPESE